MIIKNCKRAILLCTMMAFGIIYAADHREYVGFYSFTVDRHKLSTDKAERRKFLDDYFSEVLATAQEDEKGDWKITLTRPNCPAYFIDPEIIKATNEWAPGISLHEIPLFQRLSGKVFETLNDNRTLLSWSRWACERGYDRLASGASLTILHLDDHEDLMSPRVSVLEKRMQDMITGREIELTDPSSIESAIDSGAIGIGSFIPPFLFSLRNYPVQLRHLSERYRGKPSSRQWLSINYVEDGFISEASQRLNIDRLSIIEEDVIGMKHQYFVTSSVDEFLSNIPEGPILIHFDMDYFNNRFDGSSDWSSRENCHNPSLEDVMSKLRLFLDRLQVLGLKDRIEDVTVAISPGFFPGEMWQPTTQLIKDFFNS